MTTIEARRQRERDKYVLLARTGYGGTNHGRRALATVLSWQPTFVADFGCGRNDFIRQLRRRGVDGLGVDFVMDQADIRAPLHAVPLVSGIADVVTSFDALEHLLPEDVDLALSEMKRIGQPGGWFIMSISTRPSRITVNAEQLHATVRPIEWWIERISRVGIVESVNRYILGKWHA